MEMMKKVIKEVSEETGTPIEIVEAAAKAQFGFARKVMQEGEMHDVLLHGLGRFRVKDGRLNHIIKNLIKRIKRGNVGRDEGIQRLSELWKIKQKRIKK
jgi:hypothetical protein